MSSLVIPLARALADNIPSWRLHNVALWNDRFGKHSARRRQQANELFSLAKQVEQHTSLPLAA